MKGRNGDHGVDGTKGDKGEIGLQGKRGDQVGARRGSSSTRERHKDHSALSAVEGSLRCPREVWSYFGLHRGVLLLDREMQENKVRLEIQARGERR